MIDIRSMTQAEVEEYILSKGQPRFRATQVYSWLHKGITSFDEMKKGVVK